MSSWLSFSLPNPFKSDGDDGGGRNPPHPSSPGVSQTLSQHFRGVAAFLAPPPAAAANNSRSTDYVTEPALSSQAFMGIKKDLAEIGDSFKSSLSLLSSKFTSNLLQFQEDHNDYGDNDDDEEGIEDAVGITEEVVAFVEKLCSRPEIWTEFPLSVPKGFSMSDNQKGHATRIEQLVPRFTTARQTICSHDQLSDGQFWMIYFILLLPRLNEHDLELLSTPEIVEVKEILLLKLQNKVNTQVGTSEREDHTQENKSKSYQKVESTSNPEPDEQNSGSKKSKQSLEEDIDPGKSLDAQKLSESEADVSFSDLEDDDNCLSDKPSGSRLSRRYEALSASESIDWERLSENATQDSSVQKAGQLNSREKDSESESNDWLTVEDVDLENLVAA